MGSGSIPIPMGRRRKPRKLEPITPVRIESDNSFILPDHILSVQGDHLTASINPFAPCVEFFTFDAWNSNQYRIFELDLDEEARARLLGLIRNNQFHFWIEDGRFVLDQSLINYARLNEHTILAGEGEQFRLWNPSNYLHSRR